MVADEGLREARIGAGRVGPGRAGGTLLHVHLQCGIGVRRMPPRARRGKWRLQPRLHGKQKGPVSLPAVYRASAFDNALETHRWHTAAVRVVARPIHLRRDVVPSNYRERGTPLYNRPIRDRQRCRDGGVRPTKHVASIAPAMEPTCRCSNNPRRSQSRESPGHHRGFSLEP